VSSDSDCDVGFKRDDIVEAKSGKSSARGFGGVKSSSSDDCNGGLRL
jgi:hypothetical protein